MQPAFNKNRLPDRVEPNYEMLIRQGETIGDTLRIFTDEKLMSDRAADVTRFQVIIDTIRSDAASKEERHALSNQVLDYLTDPQSPANDLEVNYMLALWSDMPAIDAAANHYRQRLEAHGTEKSRLVLEKIQGTTEITEADWHDIRVGVDVTAIVELSKEVNVESIIARSTLLLDRVATATEYDAALLGDILEIETFHAPLLYLLGLPACEAILKHHTEKARIMATGDPEKIARYDKTSAYIEAVRGSGLPNAVLTDVLGVPSVDNDQFLFIIDNEMTPYGSISYFSSINCEETEDGVPMRRIISRIKSPGSHVHKELHNIDYKEDRPLDVFASTVITESVAEMTAVFREVYASIQANPACEFVTAASKDSPVHIKGKSGYMNEVQSGLSGILAEDEIDKGRPIKDEVAEPFQVLKVTFVIRNDDGIEMPVEIQFQTREDRNASRLGGASHLCSKDDNDNGLPGHKMEGADQKGVNDRRWDVSEGGERTLPKSAAAEVRFQELQADLIKTSSDDFLLLTA